MVATPVKTKRLTVQVADLTADTTAIRSLDWERDRFDIEFGLQNGTTYNSYLIRGEKIALVDTSHEKFRQSAATRSQYYRRWVESGNSVFREFSSSSLSTSTGQKW